MPQMKAQKNRSSPETSNKCDGPGALGQDWAVAGTGLCRTCTMRACASCSSREEGGGQSMKPECHHSVCSYGGRDLVAMERTEISTTQEPCYRSMCRVCSLKRHLYLQKTCLGKADPCIIIFS